MTRNQIRLMVCALSVLTALAGSCSKSPPPPPTPTAAKAPAQVSPPPAASAAAGRKKCREEKVSLPNYGDPGKRLSNCFVQYPGEPSRQDKHYYIVEDLCGQFTKEFVENMLGQSLLRIEPSKLSGVYSCRYYFSDDPPGIGNYLWLNLEYLSVERQKKGHELAGRSIKTDPRIKMEHLVVWQPDGQINEIYLVLGPQKFLSLNRSSGKYLDNEKDLQFAANLARAIKDYR